VHHHQQDRVVVATEAARHRAAVAAVPVVALRTLVREVHRVHIHQVEVPEAQEEVHLAVAVEEGDNTNRNNIIQQFQFNNI
jgi:hypothetical protein